MHPMSRSYGISGKYYNGAHRVKQGQGRNRQNHGPGKTLWLIARKKSLTAK
jgi:hypothetical protein